MRLLQVVLAAFILTGLAHAQQAREVFGKNRIQYRTFEWQYITSENFDVYYYDGRREIATQAVQFLEKEFDRITDLIGYSPYYKTKIFIYNSLTDLRQSNVGLNHTIYNINGELEFVKPYVEVAYPGTAQEFKSELTLRVAEMLINEMMYGGSLKDIFQSAYLMNLPEWFVAGAVNYVALGWTVEMDDFVRQIIRSKQVKKLSRFSGHEAALIGQSVWSFIAERYGKSSISNILNYTRITRNEEKSMVLTLGITYAKLLNEWQSYYAQMENTVRQTYIALEENLRMPVFQNRTTEFTTIKLSPDGRYLAYAENDRGSYRVKVRSLESGRETTILSGGSKVINQRVDYRLPVINWADANTLGVIAVKNGGYTFWLYDLNTRTKIPRELDRFQNIRSLSFSANGRLAVLSADYEGQSDLFLLSTRRDRVRRLTNDLYDDLDPGFIPGTNRIVFSSNRTTDSLRTKKPVLSDLTDNYNLFVFDLDTTNLVLQRITNTLSNDYAPLALNNDVFYYLSDQRGIVNLFRYDRSTGIYSQVTNYASSIVFYDLNPGTSQLALVTRQRLHDDIYLDRNFNINRNVFTPATRRRELQQARIIRERKQSEENKNISLKELLNNRLREARQPDSLSKTDTTKLSAKKNVSLDSLPLADSLAKTDSVKTKAQNEKIINTDNYVFEDEVIRQQPSETFLNRYVRSRDRGRLMGPFPYETKFGRQSMVTSFIIDQLRGFGFLMEFQMNDILENYRFYGGVMSSFDFRNGDVFGEFQLLPYYIDFSARFDRKGLRWEPFNDSEAFHYSLNRIELGAALPVSDRIRFSVKPFGALVTAASLGNPRVLIRPPVVPPATDYYAGVRTELVYDNSVMMNLNSMEGTRGKLSFNHWEGMNNPALSFSQVAVDVRHYQKIYKEIVLAVRGFGGAFFGRAPKQYLLGGMDNWVFNRINQSGTTATGEINPLGSVKRNPDILFVEFASNLRGFDYATMFGNNVLVFNAELRLPLFRTLSSGPISSNFFRNMQFVGFYDLGSSWSGPAPFRTGTAVSYEVIKKNPFEIEIKKFLNPWLYSYGVGLRTIMLGYYLKFDLAWPVLNYQVLNPRLTVTLGLDF
ncbi:MAG: translocation protein TolB [Cyclobacteriaceae bacterium]|nr:translocation protein TolB [Cyclobacteriaceae bacterium]